MEEYQGEEAYKLFLGIRKYALGDLNLFHRLSEEAEEKEAELKKSKAEEPEENEGIVTTHQTTKYPENAESFKDELVICRATIPFAMMIFSCMDILGYLLRVGKDFSNTNKNLKEFFNYIVKSLSDDEIKCLEDIFRNGIAHNYLPKFKQSISYHSKTDKTGELFVPIGADLLLNVKELERCFIMGFDKLEGDDSIYESLNGKLSDLNKTFKTHEGFKSLEKLKNKFGLTPGPSQ